MSAIYGIIAIVLHCTYRRELSRMLADIYFSNCFSKLIVIKELVVILLLPCRDIVRISPNSSITSQLYSQIL